MSKTECFAGRLGFGPCEGDLTYRVTLPELADHIPDAEPFEILSCGSEGHLGHAVGGASRNGFAVAVRVARLIAGEAEPEGEPEGEPENGMVDGARDMLRDAAQVLDELQGYGDLPISSGLIARVRALADEVGAIGEPEPGKLAEERSGMSWNDYLATLPEAQRQCEADPGHCEHDEHSTCCLCGYVTKECADPECDSTAYLNTDYCGRHQRP